MSSNTPDASSVPENPAGEQQPSPPRRRGIYQYETTGSFWGDAAEAWKRVNFREDLATFGKQPCVRSSLLAGIAAGMGIFVVRLPAAGPYRASNWGMGTMLVIGAGAREICLRNQLEERRRLQQVVEAMPARFVKAAGDAPQSPADISKT